MVGVVARPVRVDDETSLAGGGRGRQPGAKVVLGPRPGVLGSGWELVVVQPPQPTPLVEQHEPDVRRPQLPDHQFTDPCTDVLDGRRTRERLRRVQQRLAPVERASQPLFELVPPLPLRLGVDAGQPQTQLRRTRTGDLGQVVQLDRRPLPRPGVDGTQRSEDVPRRVGQRHTGVGDHSELGNGEVVPDRQVTARVGHDHRLGRGDDVLAERMSQWCRPCGRPRLGQP
jgi:hypothetical protein